jgi:hypothetical protein
VNAEELEPLTEAREQLATAVIGRKITRVERSGRGRDWDPIEITLDDGAVVKLDGYGDCCAFAGVDAFTFLPGVEHVITNVTPSGNGEQWFILANLAEVLTLDVSASEGSGYYSFGIAVSVTRSKEAAA